MNGSFTVHLEEHLPSNYVPLSSGMRRFVFESLVTSVALLAIGSFIVWRGGNLGSVSNTLHAGRVCLALSIGLSVGTVLIAAIASRRWPEWKIPPFYIRLLIASALLILVASYAYESQTGRTLLAIAAGSSITAALLYLCTHDKPLIEPIAAKRLADILNQTVGAISLDESYIDEHHLSLVYDAPPKQLPDNFNPSALPVSEAIDCLLTHGRYENALRLCMTDFTAHYVDIGVIFLVHALEHKEADAYHELIDSVESSTDLYQRILLNWMALLCRGWVTGDMTYLVIADEIARPLSETDRDQLHKAIGYYRVPDEVQTMTEQMEAINARTDHASFSDSVCEQIEEVEKQLERMIEDSQLRFVFRMLLTEADSLPYLRRLVNLLFYQVELFKDHIPNPETL